MTKIKLSARLFGSSLVVLTALSAISGLSGCAREPTPVTQQQANATAANAYIARQCVAKGFTASTPAFAYFIKRSETMLVRRANSKQVYDARAFVAHGATLINITQSDCRSLELEAMQLYQSKIDSDRQDDLDQLTDSIKQSKPRATPNPTRYANCITAGGFTNCYGY
jgi:hypothetical protein